MNLARRQLAPYHHAMKSQVLLSALLCLASFGYALFWLANKAVLLSYHRHLADAHWLLKYFIPVGIADALVPVVCVIIAFQCKTQRCLWIGAGFAILICAILFQEISLAETFLQDAQ